MSESLSSIDRALIAATQSGLPLVPKPYHALAAQLGLTAEAIMARLSAMQAQGMIRRIAAVPNHYALGYQANGMSVWDVVDAEIDRLGAQIGALSFVSHCYRRPRRLPQWPYNLFVMVHGLDRDEVAHKVAQIAALLGEAGRGQQLLYSSQILKKTGLRLV